MADRILLLWSKLRCHRTQWVRRARAMGPTVSFNDAFSGRHDLRLSLGQLHQSRTFTMTISAPFSGGCACGAIRYECTAEPFAMRNCHCHDCQRATGSPYAALLSVPVAAFHLKQGEPRYATTEAESGNTFSRGFCPTCGSSITAKASAYPEIFSVLVISLDDPSGFLPQMDCWTASAQPRNYMSPETLKFEKQPTPEQIQELLRAIHSWHHVEPHQQSNRDSEENY